MVIILQSTYQNGFLQWHNLALLEFYFLNIIYILLYIDFILSIFKHFNPSFSPLMPRIKYRTCSSCYTYIHDISNKWNNRISIYANIFHNVFGMTVYVNISVIYPLIQTDPSRPTYPLCVPTAWGILISGLNCLCPASRTTLVATRFRVAVICPIIQVPHCIRVFFYFVWFVFINHIFQFYYELCTYCNILDIYLS